MSLDLAEMRRLAGIQESADFPWSGFVGPLRKLRREAATELHVAQDAVDKIKADVAAGRGSLQLGYYKGLLGYANSLESLILSAQHVEETLDALERSV